MARKLQQQLVVGPPAVLQLQAVQLLRGPPAVLAPLWLWLPGRRAAYCLALRHDWQWLCEDVKERPVYSAVARQRWLTEARHCYAAWGLFALLTRAIIASSRGGGAAAKSDRPTNPRTEKTQAEPARRQSWCAAGPSRSALADARQSTGRERAGAGSQAEQDGADDHTVSLCCLVVLDGCQNGLQVPPADLGQLVDESLLVPSELGLSGLSLCRGLRSRIGRFRRFSSRCFLAFRHDCDQRVCYCQKQNSVTAAHCWPATAQLRCWACVLHWISIQCSTAGSGRGARGPRAWRVPASTCLASAWPPGRRVIQLQRPGFNPPKLTASETTVLKLTLLVGLS